MSIVPKVKAQGQICQILISFWIHHNTYSYQIT